MLPVKRAAFKNTPMKTYKIFAVIFCLLISSASIYSQSDTYLIEGTVNSLQTAEPLENVILSSPGAKYSAVTSDEGKFVLKIPVKLFPVRFTVKRLGYESISITADSAGYLNIRMAERLTATEEINVTGSLIETGGLDHFYITSQLNTIDELVSKAPGVTVTRRGNFASEPVVRGMNSERTGVTINGMKITCACTDKMDPVTSYAETDNLSSISLTKGSFNPEKTSGNFAAIDLRLKEPVLKSKTGFKGELTAGYMTVSDARKVEALFDLNTPVYGSVISFVYKQNKDYRTGSGEKVPYSGYNKFNITTSHIIKAGSKFSAKVDFLYDYAWDIGYPALTMDVKSAEAFITGAVFKLENPFGSVKTIEAGLYYNAITHIMDDSHRSNTIKMDMPGWTKTGGANLSTLLQWGDLKVNAKLESVFTTERAEMTMYAPNAAPMFMLTWPDIMKSEYTASVGGEKMIGRKTKILAGVWAAFNSSSIEDKLGLGEIKVFYPDFKGSDDRFIGGFFSGIKFYLSEKFTAGLNYSNSKRSLSTSEQYAFYIFNRIDAYDYVGDPYIKNENASQVEINFEGSAGKIKAGLSLFGYFFKDYIAGVIDPSLSPMTEGANGVKIYSNIPSARMLGFESSLEAELPAGFNAIGSIQYSYGEDNSGKYLPQVPPLMGTLSLRYTKGSYRLQTEAVWAAKQNKINEAYGESTTPSYAVFNLRLSAKLLKFLTVDTGVENIFDRNYYEHLDWLKIPRPGRNFYLSVKTEF